jgi:hypothetical protein
VSNAEPYQDLDIGVSKNIIKLLQFRACDKAQKAGMKIMMDFTKWDELQVYDMREMCDAYYTLFLAQTFYRFLKDEVDDEAVSKVFGKLLQLFLLTKVNEDGLYFRSLVTKDNFIGIKQRILDLCSELRPEMMALCQMMPIANRSLGPFGSEDL